ncbi:endonuclease precursor [Pseudoalteromonas luteoviolacea B = ATCC 29581]|nr:endonuclease precursor [Pseudoalteromonas luteoviolacea B = ATCC 29581]
MKKIFCLFVLVFSAVLQADTKSLVYINYDSWQIWYNCEKRGYEYFHYTTVKDEGNLSRFSPFHQEDSLPENCRQFSTSPYRTDEDNPKFDRGHGVHQNIWDHSKELMERSNSMANIVPQASYLNRYGVWRKTEELTECYRDLGKVEVWGGVIWGDNTSNDYFLKSHGVVTPDFLWKVIILPNKETYAWLMPNDDTPKAQLINDYLISPKELSQKVKLDFKLSEKELNEVDISSPKRPKGCSLK